MSGSASEPGCLDEMNSHCQGCFVLSDGRFRVATSPRELSARWLHPLGVVGSYPAREAWGMDTCGCDEYLANFRVARCSEVVD